MNITIISDKSALAVDINLRFNKRGHNSKLITVDPPADCSEVVGITKYKGRTLWFISAIRSFFYRNVLLRVDSKYQYYKDINENGFYFSPESFIRLIGSVDCILILFDYRMLTTHAIKKIYESTKVKIVWLLPDMSPFTGGCSYAWECNGYIESCKNCPAIGNPIFRKLPEYTLKAKVKNLRKVDLHVIAFSSEQFKQVQRSTVFNRVKIHRAFFPVDYTIFRPADRRCALSELGLHEDSRYFFFGAYSLNEQRKGVSLLLEALKSIEQQLVEAKVGFLIAGSDETAVREQNFTFVCKFMGLVDFTKLAKIYQASELFICTTLADSGPTMVNQSILCGTPVVSFEVGVARDIVQDSNTGFIAKFKDSETLASTILKFLKLSPSQRQRMSDECQIMREVMIKEDLVDIFSHNYLKDFMS